MAGGAVVSTNDDIVRYAADCGCEDGSLTGSAIYLAYGYLLDPGLDFGRQLARLSPAERIETRIEARAIMGLVLATVGCPLDSGPINLRLEVIVRLDGFTEGEALSIAQRVRAAMTRPDVIRTAARIVERAKS